MDIKYGSFINSETNSTKSESLIIENQNSFKAK